MPSSSGRKRGEIERLALQLVNEAGDKGILQSELWKLIGVTSREGSRIAIRLEKKNLIRREREYSSKRWTYRLYPVRKNHPLLPILDSPCLVCEDNSRCNIQDVVSPLNCRKLMEWVLKTQKSS
ncbi:hypothetical protein DRO57_03880 [Candidatus Bathyarchaeota archaeon]|nr:MAG: hypothetical protein DRO57_03880 [Candidatus Bathyarchaeota archaeon]